MNGLLKFAARNRIIVFAGAGVSMGPPTCLPSWIDINRSVLEALAARLTSLIGKEKADDLAKRISERQQANRFPPEYQAQVIAGRLRDSYFQVLQCLDSQIPNATHVTLARLARVGKLRAILTTNFDRAFEAAFDRHHVPYEVHSNTAQFNKLAENLDRIERSDLPCQIIKLHGSAEDPTTLVDTLAQRKRGLPPSATRCLRHLLGFGHWLFLGYSGDDLAAEPNYLYLRPGIAEAQGFTWLVREGSTARPAVEKLVREYGSRASVVVGDLPDWLEAFAESVAPGTAVTTASFSAAQITAERQRARDAVTAHTRRWVDEQRFDRCVLVMADLLSATDEPSAAFDLLTALHTTTPIADRKSGHFAVVLNSLANAHQLRGEFDRALEFFREALTILKEHDASPAQLAGIHNNMGLVFERQGREGEALSSFREACDAVQCGDDDHAHAVAIHNLAMANARMRRVEEAISLYRTEIEMATKLGDVPGRAIALNILGEMLLDRTEKEEALKCLNESLEAFDRLGDEYGAALAKGNIAKLRISTQEYEAARKLYDECHAVYSRFGDGLNLVLTLSNIGLLDTARGNITDAISRFGESLAVAEKLHSHSAQAKVLNGLIQFYRTQGDYEEAVRCAKRLVSVWEQPGSPMGRLGALERLGFLYLESGKFEESEATLREAVKLSEANNVSPRTSPAHDGLANVLGRLGLRSQDQKNYADAQRLFSESAMIYQQMDSAFNRGQSLLNLGNTYAMSHKFADALSALRDSVQCFDDANAKEASVTAFTNMAKLEAVCGHIDQALGLLSEAENRCSDVESWREVRLLASELARGFPTGSASGSRIPGSEQQIAAELLVAKELPRSND